MDWKSKFLPETTWWITPTFQRRNADGKVIASSHHDFVLLCPKMSQLHPVTHIWEYSGLPDHNPIVVSFRIPCHYGKIKQWKLPRVLDSCQCSKIKSNLSTYCLDDDDDITLDNWSSRVEDAWAKLLQPSAMKLRPNQKGRGRTLRTKNVPPIRSPRNPHDWDLSKIKIWKERMLSLSSIKLNCDRTVAFNTSRVYTPTWVIDRPNSIMRRLIAKIKNPIM